MKWKQTTHAYTSYKTCIIIKNALARTKPCLTIIISWVTQDRFKMKCAYTNGPLFLSSQWGVIHTKYEYESITGIGEWMLLVLMIMTWWSRSHNQRDEIIWSQFSSLPEIVQSSTGMPDFHSEASNFVFLACSDTMAKITEFTHTFLFLFVSITLWTLYASDDDGCPSNLLLRAKAKQTQLKARITHAMYKCTSWQPRRLFIPQRICIVFVFVLHQDSAFS